MDFPQALAGVFHPFAEVSNGAADGGALIGLPAELEDHAAARAIRRVCAGQLDPFALSLDALPLTVVPFDLRAIWASHVVAAIRAIACLPCRRRLPYRRTALTGYSGLW